MNDMLSMYLNLMKMSILQQFQYRVANYFYMIGMITEPVVYLVVWTTIARAQGGEVAGYTAGQFAAYYIIWTLVRNMNIVFTPYGWEFRIRRGELSGMLTRPVHPLHFDLGYFAGWKFVVILMWLPIAGALALIFKPELNPTLLEIGVFFIAIWGAYLVRSMWQWAIGLISFWTTRVGAIFELYFTIELLLSGRLVPLALLPGWAQNLANFLPFKYAFGFPIETLVGQMTPQQMLAGLGMQAFWILSGLAVVLLTWKVAVRRYSAVGG
jgi:ABC-2 type transport system permease protein